jgi:hypothetical protein
MSSLSRNPIAQVVTAPNAENKDRQTPNQIDHGNGPQLNPCQPRDTAPWIFDKRKTEKVVTHLKFCAIRSERPSVAQHFVRCVGQWTD